MLYGYTAVRRTLLCLQKITKCGHGVGASMDNWDTEMCRSVLSLRKLLDWKVSRRKFSVNEVTFFLFRCGANCGLTNTLRLRNCIWELVCMGFGYE